MNVLEKAIGFASKAHEGTFRKGSSVPFILHPLEAASIAAGMTGDLELLAAVVLHDTVEDTETSAEVLRNTFGERVASFVASDSENKRPELAEEKTWLLRKQESLQKMAKANKNEQILILSDKLSNMRALSRDYKALGDKLWARFNNRDPGLQLAYYQAILPCCKDLQDTEAYREYSRLLQELCILNGIRPDAEMFKNYNPMTTY